MEHTFDNGQVMSFEPLTMADWDAFGVWLNQQEGLPARKPRGIQKLYEAVDTLSGAVWVLHRCAIKCDPAVTIDKIRELVGNPLALAQMQDALLLHLCSLPQPDGSPDRPTQGDPPTP